MRGPLPRCVTKPFLNGPGYLPSSARSSWPRLTNCGGIRITHFHKASHAVLLALRLTRLLMTFVSPLLNPTPRCRTDFTAGYVDLSYAAASPR